jgi:hypothetical protein
MRKVLAFLLLAGAAAPALAAGDPGERHGGWRHDSSQQSSDNSSDRSDRPRFTRVERSDNDGNARPEPQVRVRPQVETHVDASGGAVNEARFHHGFVNRMSSGGQATVNAEATAGADHRDVERIREIHNEQRETTARTNWRGRVIENPNVTVQDRTAPVLREQDRPLPRVFRNRVPIVSNSPREGTQPPLRIESRRRIGGINWSTNWRNDDRYDWHNWRRHHRSTFHLGVYFDPFGWSYRPYQIGWRLWPSYYRSSFWINDPWQYRLPYAPPGTRWIRYYDDAVLVDTWSGEVVDVIYNFFW